MNNNLQVGFAITLLMLVAPACSQGPADDGADARISIGDSLTGLLGNHTQGLQPQGLQPQGNNPQSSNLKGYTFQSFANIDGPITDVTLTKTSLSGTGAYGALSGEDFIGSTVTAVRLSGSTFTMRIDDIEVSEDSDVLHYQLSFDNGTEWVNPCGTDVPAVPLAGRWDYSSDTETGGDYIDDSTMFTFGCTTGLLTKCLVFGYKPWEELEECHMEGLVEVCENIPKRYFHQACTRMMRADYCGRGSPHTVDGTMINLYDYHGLQLDESNMDLEAEWSPEGATCISHARWTAGGQEVVDLAQDDIDLNCSFTQSQQALADCGSSNSTFTTESGYAATITTRALLRDESPSPPPP